MTAGISLRIPRITDLEHWDSVVPRFRALADLPWAIWLDSAAPGIGDGRYSILAADPYLTLRTRGELTTIARRDGGTRVATESPLELLRLELGEPGAGVGSLPFCGGALGYFGYDLGRRYEKLPALAVADIDMPELAVGLYDWAVVVDHLERRSWLVGQGRDPETFAHWDSLLERLHAQRLTSAHPFKVLSPVSSSFDRASYAAAFRRVQDYIRRGDCYQVNLTQRFRARAEGDAWHAYLRLREINPAPFSAFLSFPDGKVLCSSPERFLRVAGGEVETKPIKGTRPRVADDLRNRALAEELRASAKDRAENVMIVDLLRNDLGKSCVPGSVHVEKLFDVETFAHVHHLVSTVRGRLAARQASARATSRSVPRRLHHGCAESSGDADHRGAGAAQTRRLLRLHRLRRLRRQHGLEHCHQNPRAAWGVHLCVGGRRRRRRFGGRGRIPGEPRQGRRAARGAERAGLRLKSDTTRCGV